MTHHKGIQSINQCQRNSTLTVMSCTADGSQLILHEDITPLYCVFKRRSSRFAAVQYDEMRSFCEQTMDWLQQQYHLPTLLVPLGKHAAGTHHTQKQTSRLLHLCSAEEAMWSRHSSLAMGIMPSIKTHFKCICATICSDVLPEGVLLLQRYCASPIVPGTLHSWCAEGGMCSAQTCSVQQRCCVPGKTAWSRWWLLSPGVCAQVRSNNRPPLSVLLAGLESCSGTCCSRLHADKHGRRRRL